MEGSDPQEATAASWILADQLIPAITAKDSGDRIIAGSVMLSGGYCYLVRGNMETLRVPLSFFNPSGNGTAPDFTKFAIDDYGHSILFGEYGVSVDAILYEFDPDYRARADVYHI